MTEQLHVLPVIFIREGQSLLNRVELNETSHDSCVLLHGLAHSLRLLHYLTHVLCDLEDSHIETRVLLLVLVQESLKVLVHCVQEGVHFFQTGLRQHLNRVDPIVDHRGELLPLILVFLGGHIELKEDDLAHLDDLLMRQLKVFVRYGHLEVRIH